MGEAMEEWARRQLARQDYERESNARRYQREKKARADFAAAHPYLVKLWNWLAGIDG